MNRKQILWNALYLLAAIERLVAGLEKKTRVLNPRERKTVAYAVRELLRAAFDTATAMLTRGHRVLERGAESLLERETLGETELAKLKAEFEALPGGSVIKLSSA